MRRLELVSAAAFVALPLCGNREAGADSADEGFLVPSAGRRNKDRAERAGRGEKSERLAGSSRALQLVEDHHPLGTPAKGA